MSHISMSIPGPCTTPRWLAEMMKSVDAIVPVAASFQFSQNMGRMLMPDCRPDQASRGTPEYAGVSTWGWRQFARMDRSGRYGRWWPEPSMHDGRGMYPSIVWLINYLGYPRVSMFAAQSRSSRTYPTTGLPAPFKIRSDVSAFPPFSSFSPSVSTTICPTRFAKERQQERLVSSSRFPLQWLA